ncbi:MAG: (Fe-S)-binding protein, partial [Thermoprotei archaeon]
YHLVNVDTCMRCTLCADSCPTYTASGDLNVAPALRVRLLKQFIEGKGSDITRELCREAFRCTICGKCMEVCPFSIRTADLWYLLRYYTCKAGKRPEALEKFEESLLSNKNPYGTDTSLRVYWAEMLGLNELPGIAPRKANVALFMGCTPSYRSVAQDTLAAAVLLLNKVKESWTILGEEEWCCGCPLLMLGNREAAAEFAKHNVELVESLGATVLVTICATCYKMFKLEYEELLGRPLPFKVLHMTELLAKYVTELKLELPNKLDVKVAYHDPCDLARMSGVIEAPRLLIKEAAKELVELPENKLNTTCCGGGGLLQAVDNELRLKIAKKRVKEALDAGADVLASACPACKSSFVEAVREEGVDIEVTDVVELVARAAGLSW